MDLARRNSSRSLSADLASFVEDLRESEQMKPAKPAKADRRSRRRQNSFSERSYESAQHLQTQLEKRLSGVASDKLWSATKTAGVFLVGMLFTFLLITSQSLGSKNNVPTPTLQQAQLEGMDIDFLQNRYHAARVGRLLPEVELQTLSNKQPLSQQDLVANARAQAIQSRILENLDPSRSGSQSQQAAATSQKQDSAAQRNSIFNALTAGGTKNWQALDLGRKGNLEEAAEKAEYNAHLDHMMAGAYAEDDDVDEEYRPQKEEVFSNRPLDGMLRLFLSDSSPKVVELDGVIDPHATEEKDNIDYEALKLEEEKKQKQAALKLLKDQAIAEVKLQMKKEAMKKLKEDSEDEQGAKKEQEQAARKAREEREAQEQIQADEESKRQLAAISQVKEQQEAKPDQLVSQASEASSVTESQAATSQVVLENQEQPKAGSEEIQKVAPQYKDAEDKAKQEEAARQKEAERQADLKQKAKSREQAEASAKIQEELRKQAQERLPQLRAELEDAVASVDREIAEQADGQESNPQAAAVSQVKEQQEANPDQSNSQASEASSAAEDKPQESKEAVSKDVPQNEEQSNIGGEGQVSKAELEKQQAKLSADNQKAFLEETQRNEAQFKDAVNKANQEEAARQKEAERQADLKQKAKSREQAEASDKIQLELRKQAQERLPQLRAELDEAVATVDREIAQQAAEDEQDEAAIS